MSGGNVWKAISVVLLLALVVTIIAVPKDTEDCRLAALDAMCERYGNSTGGAENVFASQGGFWVQCREGKEWNVNVSQ